MNNKSIFAENLKKYMKLNKKTRKDVCNDLDFSYYTFSDWINGKKYPRMDKVEKLANYFGILKSDLIENEVNEDINKKNDAITDIIIRLRTDEEYLDLVSSLCNLDGEKIKSVKNLLSAFLK